MKLSLKQRQLVTSHNTFDHDINYQNVKDFGALYLRIIEIGKQIEELKEQEIQYEKRMLELEYKSYVL